MPVEPLRNFAGSSEFSDSIGELNRNNTLAKARLGMAALGSYWDQKANKEIADARAYGGQGGGFSWGDALSLGGSLLGAARGAGLFRGGSSSIAPGSVAQANGVTVRPGFYGPAF